MAIAPYHLHLDTTPFFLRIPAGHAQRANIELASELIVANLGHGGRDGMIVQVHTEMFHVQPSTSD